MLWASFTLEAVSKENEKVFTVKRRSFLVDGMAAYIENPMIFLTYC